MFILFNFNGLNNYNKLYFLLIRGYLNGSVVITSVADEIEHGSTTTSNAVLDCGNLFLCFFAFLLFPGKERERLGFHWLLEYGQLW